MVLAGFILSLAAQLQAAVIAGRVADAASGKGLEGASLTLDVLGLGGSAGRNGEFLLLGVPGGQWHLTASHIGYRAETVPLTLSASDTAHLNLRLYEQTVSLEEVVFTATRTLRTLKRVPVATELITRTDVERRAVQTAADALDGNIGLDVSDDFAGRGVILQGVDPDKVLILVDGNRVIGRVNGSLDLDQISVGNVKQIEVVKGAVSTLYGSEAIGGVINIITDAPRGVRDKSDGTSDDEPLRITIDGNAGGWMPDRARPDFRSSNVSSGATFAARGERFGVWGAARGTRIGLTDIDPSTNHTEGVNATDRFNGDLRIDYYLSDKVTLTSIGRTMTEEKEWVEDGGLISAPVSFDDVEFNDRRDGSSELLCTPRGSERYSVKLYRSDNSHDWRKKTQAIWGAPRVTDFSKGDESYTELSSLLTYPVSGGHLLTTGADVYRWDISTDARLGSISSPYSAAVTAWDALLQDEWELHPQWTLVPGLRYEHQEVYGSHWSPRLSAMWLPVSDVRVRASAGNGYRAPSSKELYFVFNHSSAGYVVYGNPDLRPEESSSYTLSFEHDYRNSSVARLSFFYNDMRNLIDFDSIGVSEDYYTGIFQYNNIASAWTRGVEVERGFKPLKWLDLKLAYIFLESHNRETDARLVRRPQHGARWDIAHRRGLWTTNIWGKYVGRALYQDIYNTDAQITDEWSPAFQLWNAVVTGDLLGRLQVYIKIENLTDKTHPRYGPRQGRVVSIGGKWTIK